MGGCHPLGDSTWWNAVVTGYRKALVSSAELASCCANTLRKQFSDLVLVWVFILGTVLVFSLNGLTNTMDNLLLSVELSGYGNTNSLTLIHVAVSEGMLSPN